MAVKIVRTREQLEQAAQAERRAVVLDALVQAITRRIIAEILKKMEVKERNEPTK